jgi:hypothetical protein
VCPKIQNIPDGANVGDVVGIEEGLYEDIAEVGIEVLN